MTWWQWLKRLWQWMGDAAEASHRGQRETFGTDPGTLDDYEPLDHPHHRKDTSDE